MHKFKLAARRLEPNPPMGVREISKTITSDDPLYLQGLAMTLEEDGYRDIVIEPNLMSYEPNTLPHPDWDWEGAMAGPDGFSGRAYIANVAKDPQGQLWVFTKHGRFRVHREEFQRKLISSLCLAGLPLHLEPSD
jgi:hypothetical protein